MDGVSRRLVDGTAAVLHPEEMLLVCSGQTLAFTEQHSKRQNLKNNVNVIFTSPVSIYIEQNC